MFQAIYTVFLQGLQGFLHEHIPPGHLVWTLGLAVSAAV